MRRATFISRIALGSPSGNSKFFSGVAAQGLNAKAPDVSDLVPNCSLEVQKAYKQMTAEIEKKKIPPTSLLHSILQHCESQQDMELALEALHRLRIVRSSRAHAPKNFNQTISSLLISASLRIGMPDLGLKSLWKHNKYGLSPTLTAAQLFLNHAKQQKDVNLMRKVLDTMATNSVHPTTQTAETVFRLCKDVEDGKLMLKLAKEFSLNGVQLSATLYDIVISQMANAGDVKGVWETQRLRKKAKLDHTTASAFACAKASLLETKSEEAANLIVSNCKDKAKRDKYLDMMVRVWPNELTSKLDESSRKELCSTLKDRLNEFVEALSVEGCDIPESVLAEVGRR